jgi:hypothetical protein
MINIVFALSHISESRIGILLGRLVSPRLLVIIGRIRRSACLAACVCILLRDLIDTQRGWLLVVAWCCILFDVL